MPLPLVRPVLLAGAAAGLLLAGCGSSGTNTAGSSRSTSPTTSAAPVVTPTSAAPTSASALTPVTKATFLARFKNEPGAQDLSADELDCVSGVYLKYLDEDELRRYVTGSVTMDDLGDPDNPAAKKEMLTCLAGELPDN